MAASALSPPPGLSISTRYRASALSSVPQRHFTLSPLSAICIPQTQQGLQPVPFRSLTVTRKLGVHIVLVSVFFRLCFKRRDEDSTAEHPPLPPPFWVLTIPKNYGAIKAFMPAVMTPLGPVDLSVVLFRNRTIFIGDYIDAMLAEGVISQLVTLAAIDDADIWVFLNSVGGDPYSVFAIYDCMSWVKPKVGTVCFGMAASHATLVLAGGEKGMRYSMPNARIMIHQPRGAMGGDFLELKTQVNETVYTKNKIDLMYAAFTGQPLDLIQTYTEKDRYFSAAEAADFGLIDGLMETAC
ncbi:hypothetical protein RHGRI_013567 [Rhododendron griersonianum]|uniref:ATP-dependent Clp protease proteolytic subunit n=1 Tax=Rhododendron griersonianum TaxID=479676 RepID=A0AAV6K630_9ERIC|nr:hypothetical protein RHGRI_013567 [Rhododendron griersonianum]